MSTYKVAVHNGNAHVASSCRWPYIIASVYKARKTKDGRWIWSHHDDAPTPRRGEGICEKDAEELADKYNCETTIGYGSPHNQPLNQNEVLDLPFIGEMI